MKNSTVRVRRSRVAINMYIHGNLVEPSRGVAVKSLTYRSILAHDYGIAITNLLNKQFQLQKEMIE